MKSVVGLLWALGGAVAGLIVGVIAAVVMAKVTNASNREGEQGYVMIAFALIGAVIGLVLGLVLYARSAPSGQASAFFSSGTMGVFGLVAVIAAALWAFMNLREAPLKYGNAMANLEMEFRTLTTSIPADADERWLNVEVQTSSTRPEGTVMWSRRRTEGAYTVVPAVQGPLYRSGSRFIVVRLREMHDEMFNPPMKRTPNRKADWSAWYPPASVDPPYGVTPPSPLKAMLEMRYRVRAYGDQD